LGKFADGIGFAKGDLEIRAASCEDPFGCAWPARMKKKNVTTTTTNYEKPKTKKRVHAH
jgi:hypothetical protein